jgi:hypothetical protein
MPYGLDVVLMQVVDECRGRLLSSLSHDRGINISTVSRREEEPMVRKFVAAASAALAIAVATAAGWDAFASANTGSAGIEGAPALGKPIRFEQHDLYIEFNATAGDAGLQLGADAESWKRFTLYDPEGKVLIHIDSRGRLHTPFALSELFMEASEPSFTQVPFAKFKRRFPEGTYQFRGVTGNGRRLVGSDRLSHLIPAAPAVTSPTEGTLVDPNGFTVSWEPVTRPAGVQIATYQVIVIQGDRELSMYVPPDITSVTIPGEFLEPGMKTGGEVLARDVSGNQTITELPSFRTSG